MYQLKVTVIAKNGSKPLFERILEVDDAFPFSSLKFHKVVQSNHNSNFMCLGDVPFGSFIESLSVLFGAVPHVITFSFEKL